MNLKNINSPKDIVKIRFKKLKSGALSIYLDTYYNKIRKYEFLKLYITNAKSKSEKDINKLTLKTALNIKYQRITQVLNNRSENSKFAHKPKTLIEWCDEIRKQKLIMAQSNSSAQIFAATIKHIHNYSPKYLVNNVDKNFIIGFMEYLKKCGLSDNTVCAYFSALNYSLSEAVKCGIINYNPANCLSKREIPKFLKSTPKFLTVENLRALILANCPNQEIKHAFLFSCFTGLRFSDIKNLTAENFVVDDSQIRLIKKIQKTQNIVCTLLPTSAAKLININAKNNIFNLPSISTVEKTLKIWATNARINKTLTFHCARHTFATLLLTQGADLYTISKLLGHSNIATTQIYANVINEHKDEIIKLLDALNL